MTMATEPWKLRIETEDTEMTAKGLAYAFITFGDGNRLTGWVRPEDARLAAAAKDLLAAQTMGAQVNTPDFLDWVADRLVHVYGESPNIDFVHSLRDRATAGRDAIAKAIGQ
jgi:hypothetical protein